MIKRIRLGSDRLLCCTSLGPATTKSDQPTRERFIAEGKPAIIQVSEGQMMTSERRRCPSITPLLSSFGPPQSEKSTETAKQNSPQRQQIAAPQLGNEASDCGRNENGDPGSHSSKAGSSFFAFSPDATRRRSASRPR
jgi:hypothetical protein